MIEKINGAKRNYRKYSFSFDKKEFDILTFELEFAENTVEFPKEFEEEFKAFCKEVEEKLKKEEEDRKILSFKKEIGDLRVNEITFSQGDKQWLMSRMGLITASDTPFNAKGEKIPTFSNYVNKKIREFIYKKQNKTLPESETILTPLMEKGSKLEPLIKKRYEALYQETIEDIGLLKFENMPLGASPDGVVFRGLERFNVEIKTTLLNNYIAEKFENTLQKKYNAQMQVQMLLTGTERTVFIVSCSEEDILEKNFPLLVKEIERDDVFLMNCFNTLKEFEEEFSYKIEKLGY